MHCIIIYFMRKSILRNSDESYTGASKKKLTIVKKFEKVKVLYILDSLHVK